MQSVQVILNVFWLVFGGLLLAIGWVFAGVLMCVLIITIPFGIQAFKIASFALWPFGRTLVKRPERNTVLSIIGNVIWLIPGIFLALGHLFAGIVLCITIIGIPLGIANFKLAGVSLVPFGREVVPVEIADARERGISI